MAEYLIRISLNYSLAQENLEGQGEIWQRVLGELENGSATLIVQRYTFGVYIMRAESESECKSKALSAWNRACPDARGGIGVLVTPFDDSDASKLMMSIYSSYYGVEEYQRLVTSLTSEIPLLRERGALRALRMQNYLFAIDQGCGFTSLLASFGDYLRRMKVYEDESDERTDFAEFQLYKDTDGERISTNDVIEALMDDDSRRYGVVGLDVSYFLDVDKTDELRRFIKRLYVLQDKFVFVFKVPFLEKRALEKVEQLLSDVMLLRVVEIPPMHDCVLLEYLWDCMRRLGYMADISIIEPFFNYVRAEKKDGRFYGFKTAEKITQQMVLKKASRSALGFGGDASVVCSDDLDPDFDNGTKEKSGYEALDELIGMDDVGRRVREIVAQVKLSMKSETLDRPCIHMRFLGAPGTGKTTVARIIGQIFREEGILRKGSFLEYSARSLCAEYVGQTAVKTASVCRDAYGSVLFLDEAYALYDGDHGSNDYGKEALTTLISEMENHRDDMLVIMAGYTDDMETLMNGNAGLRSRMPYAITFPNYTRYQLFEIFMLMVKKHFKFTDGLQGEAKKYFESLTDAYVSSKEFANARFVRNLYERTWSKAALRASLSGLDEIELTSDDFLVASADSEFSEKIEVKNRIGF